ncbi:phosphate uptake regulator PhoU [Candidatus Woesearchaeota archaeon]|nr:phosphate uptake regulator PhoU [Candidatus Woesearchaeota archaeon]
MDFRKVIKFGEASFVVSLPKEWINKQAIKKGDFVAIEEDQEALRITPNNNHQKKSAIKEVTIEFENLKEFRSELVFAYINGFNPITITGKNLSRQRKEINNIVHHHFAALEIVQQTAERIIIKDFLNIQEISIHDVVRRIDRIILSMAEDVQLFLRGKKIGVVETLDQKETDVDRLSNMIFKTLKRCFNPNDRKILNLGLDDIFYYWELALFLENVADQLKRIPTYIKKRPSTEIAGVLSFAIGQYENAMKANFTGDTKLAMNVLAKRTEVYNNADKEMHKLRTNELAAVEKMKRINNLAGNIAKVLLRLNYRKE